MLCNVRLYRKRVPVIIREPGTLYVVALPFREWAPQKDDKSSGLFSGVKGPPTFDQKHGFDPAMPVPQLARDS